MARKKVAEKKVWREPGAIAQLERMAKLCEVGSLVLEAVGLRNRVSDVGVFEAFEHVDGGVVLRAEGELPAGARKLQVVRRKKEGSEVLLRSVLKPDSTGVVAIMRVRLTPLVAVTTE